MPTLNINGKTVDADVPADTPLLWTLRDVLNMAGTKITTIEAIGEDTVGKAVQAAWIELGVPQCGYCHSGQIMAATALLKQNPKPSDADIDAAMSGNLCRCGTYPRIRAAIKQTASTRGGKT